MILQATRSDVGLSHGVIDAGTSMEAWKHGPLDHGVMQSGGVKQRSQESSSAIATVHSGHVLAS